MTEKVFSVSWRISGEFNTIMLARFGWWRFQIGWPYYDKCNQIAGYPLEVYHRGELKGLYKFRTLDKCTGWIMETCKDLALAEPIENKHC